MVGRERLSKRRELELEQTRHVSTFASNSHRCNFGLRIRVVTDLHSQASVLLEQKRCREQMYWGDRNP